MIEQKVKIKYFSPDYPKLEYIEGKSDWIDLRSNKTIVIKKGEHCLIPLGVAIQLPKGYEALVAPRSSSFKKWGIIQTNTPGIIDETYCGPNDQWFMSVYATRTVKIDRFDRVCQFRILEHQPTLLFEESDLTGNTSRGGHGSTGSN